MVGADRGTRFAPPAGVRQLWALHEARPKFYTDEILPGGCFFGAIQIEFDDRPGAVHDRLTEQAREWDAFVRSIIRGAIEAGELRPETDPGVLAFELDTRLRRGPTFADVGRRHRVRPGTRRALVAPAGGVHRPPRGCRSTEPGAGADIRPHTRDTGDGRATWAA